MSTGRGDTYPHYRCRTQAAQCPWGGKSVAKEELEFAYGALLKSLETKPAAYRLACECAISLWDQRYQDVEKQRRVIAERDLVAVQKQIAALLDKIATVSSDRVIRSLEEKIEALLGRRELLLTEEMKFNDTHQVSFGTAVEAVLGFLKSPYFAWCQSDRHDQIQAQKQAFSEPCVYDRDSGFGTAKISLGIWVLGQFAVSKSHGVDMLKKSWNQFVEYVFETHAELEEYGRVSE